MIAMALVLDPVLLIADEPTTALDVTTRRKSLKLIGEPGGQAPACCSSPTTSASSPRLPIASPVMHWGQLVEMGLTPQIPSRTRHGYTRC